MIVVDGMLFPSSPADNNCRSSKLDHRDRSGVQDLPLRAASFARRFVGRLGSDRVSLRTRARPGALVSREHRAYGSGGPGTLGLECVHKHEPIGSLLLTDIEVEPPTREHPLKQHS